MCSVKLPFEELMVDEPMNQLIKNLPEEVTQIRVDDKGQYVAVFPRRGGQDSMDPPSGKSRLCYGALQN